MVESFTESAPGEKDPIQRCCNKSSYPGLGSVVEEHGKRPYSPKHARILKDLIKQLRWHRYSA